MSKKHNYQQWIITSIEVMYMIRGLQPTPAMKAIIVLPDDIIAVLLEQEVVTMRRRTKVFPFVVDGETVYLKVTGCGNAQTKMQIKIAT